MCIYDSHWINLPDIFSSIKQNTQMWPLLLSPNCLIFSRRETGSHNQTVVAWERFPNQPLCIEEGGKATEQLRGMGRRYCWGREGRKWLPLGRSIWVTRYEKQWKFNIDTGRVLNSWTWIPVWAFSLPGSDVIASRQTDLLVGVGEAQPKCLFGGLRGVCHAEISVPT